MQPPDPEEENHVDTVIITWKEQSKDENGMPINLGWPELPPMNSAHQTQPNQQCSNLDGWNNLSGANFVPSANANSKWQIFLSFEVIYVCAKIFPFCIL